jgi:hypothetical protein
MSEQVENEIMSTQELRAALMADIEASKQVIQELSEEALVEIVGGVGGSGVHQRMSPLQSPGATFQQPGDMERHLERIDQEQQQKWGWGKSIAGLCCVATIVGAGIIGGTHLWSHYSPPAPAPAPSPLTPPSPVMPPHHP